MSNDWWIPILIVLVIAIIAFALSYTAVRFGWYQGLDKPDFYYNEWIYSPLWYIIYGLIIYAWIRMVTILNNKIVTHIMFTLQLLFMLAWIITFFYYRNIKGSMVFLFISIVILVVLILMSLNDPLSLILLVVYLVWLLYLLYTTWHLSILNPRRT